MVHLYSKLPGHQRLNRGKIEKEVAIKWSSHSTKTQDVPESSPDESGAQRVEGVDGEVVGPIDLNGHGAPRSSHCHINAE